MADKRTKKDKEAQEETVGGTAKENFKEQKGSGEDSEQTKEAAANNPATGDTTVVSRESGYFTGTGVVANPGLDVRLPGYADIPYGSPRAAQILAEERERGHDLSDTHYEDSLRTMAEEAERSNKQTAKEAEKLVRKQHRADEKALKEAQDTPEGEPSDEAVDTTIALKASSGAMAPAEVLERVENAKRADDVADVEETEEDSKEAEKDAKEKEKAHKEAQKELKEKNDEREAARKNAEKNLQAGEAPGVNADAKDAKDSKEK